MRGLFANPHLALESIQFQTPLLFRELTLIFQNLASQSADGKKDEVEADEITAAIRRHTGLNLTVLLDQYMPCVEIPEIDRNNILVNSAMRNFLTSGDGLRMISKAEDVVRGTVDLKHAKVTGVFTEIGTTIHLPQEFAFSGTKYAPEEMAAIVLHEVGHIFTYFEYISRTVRTNQALAGLSKALDGSGTPEEREMILINTKKALKLSKLNEKELAKSTDAKVIETVVVVAHVEETVSELGSNIYDMTSWEYLADQFAARMGAGRYLVTGLEKLFRGMGHISFRSTPMYVALEALKFALLLGAFVPALMPVGGYLLLGGLYMTMRDSQATGDYDTPEARFRRIRNQVVEALKDKRIKPQDRTALLADMEAIDKVMKTVNDRRQVLSVVYDAVAFWEWNDERQIKLQKQLEDLATNDLFVRAAEFRQHAG